MVTFSFLSRPQPQCGLELRRCRLQSLSHDPRQLQRAFPRGVAVVVVAGAEFLAALLTDLFPERDAVLVQIDRRDLEFIESNNRSV